MNLGFGIILSLCLTAGAAHAGDAEKAASILSKQYLTIGEATGHDLSGNNLRTTAEQIHDGLQTEPDKEKEVIKFLCNEMILPQIVRPAAEVTKLAQKVPKLKSVVNGENYRVVIAYPAALCGAKIDLTGISPKLQKAILSVSGNFNKYFDAVQSNEYQERISKYSEAYMEALGN